MIYIPEKEEIIQNKNWTTEYSLAFFNNERRNCDKLMVFGSGLSHHGFVVNGDSKLFGFGWNFYFQLGLGDNNDRTKLSEIKFFSSKRKFKKISCGNQHSIFLTENKEVYSTGNNENGQLGLFNNINNVFTMIPTRVIIKHQNEIIKVIDIFVGSHHSFVLSNLLEIYSFGCNSQGQLGVGDTKNRDSATKIHFSEKILSVCGGAYHSCFISVKGSVFVCGRNRNGQLGFNSKSDVNITPKKILFFKKKKILQVSCGRFYTLFVTEDNKVYGTGYNYKGELGIGNTFNQRTPCLVASLKDEKVNLVKCGGYHSFLKCKEKIMMCGWNNNGQIGDEKYKNVITPILLKGKEIFIQSLMLSYSSIHFTKNEAYGCGANDWGQLFCGKTKLKNPNIFKIRNLKVKRFLELPIELRQNVRVDEEKKLQVKLKQKKIYEEIQQLKDLNEQLYYKNKQLESERKEKNQFKVILEDLKSEKDSIIKKNKKIEKEKNKVEVILKNVEIENESIIKKNQQLKEKIKVIFQKEKGRERDIEIYFQNQTNLRFTSLMDYKILELIGGKISGKNQKKGVNGFIYKIEFGEKLFAMKILRIPKGQDAKTYDMLSKGTAEILLVIKPEFLSFIPHKNIISIYHAFKEDLTGQNLKQLENVEGDKNNEVVKLFNSSDFLNKKTGFLVMEYFESNLEDLKKKKNSNFSENEFLVILEQLLEGLNHIYCRNIVHRDIKPDNIFVKSLYLVVVALMDKNSAINLKKKKAKDLLKLFILNFGDQFGDIVFIKEKTFCIECKTEKWKLKLLEMATVYVMGEKCSISDPDKNRSNTRCVIGDFGCSFVCKDSFIVPKRIGKQVHQISGNPYHFPPEVHDSISSISSKEIDYSKNDIFAIGLTCYSIICNNDPFGGVNADKRRKKDYIPIKNNFSKETKELIGKLCCVDKGERDSVEFALSKVRQIRNSFKVKNKVK